jgi:hypothetical protein
VSRFERVLRSAGAVLALALLGRPGMLWAQVTEPLSSQSLGRPYLFVFIAYAIVLGLIAAFVVSIAVRLARVEKRLKVD